MVLCMRDIAKPRKSSLYFQAKNSLEITHTKQIIDTTTIYFHIFVCFDHREYAQFVNIFFLMEVFQRSFEMCHGRGGAMLKMSRCAMLEMLK